MFGKCKAMAKSLIFLSLIRIDSLDERGIYHDLLREFLKNGYKLTIVCPVERVTNLPTRIISSENLNIIQVRVLNIQKCNILEKGLSTLTLNYFFKRAIRRFIKDFNFDLILYSTPPITLFNLIVWLKSKNDAKTYLLLKDIFPQNAVDIGYFNKWGVFNWYFSIIEKRLYQISDRIGCMSPANVTYLENLFPQLKIKLEVNPNSIDLTRIPVINETKNNIRFRWSIPQDATVFLYGGNLGKPQGVDFLIEIISHCINEVPNAYFLIVGDGTEFKKISNWFNVKCPTNAQLIKMLPKYEFDTLAFACNVGLIFLIKDFTIPNFPSRLLTYLENKLPILAMTDSVTDIGKIAEENSFGKWIKYGDLENVIKIVSFYCNENQQTMLLGINGFNFLQLNYSSKTSYNLINQFLDN